MKHFDAIIIGTGQAGPPLAARFAGDGKTVAIIERHKFGGTCVNTGCTSTKTAPRIEPNRVMDLLRSQPSQRRARGCAVQLHFDLFFFVQCVVVLLQDRDHLGFGELRGNRLAFAHQLAQ